jgi:hypothetical protein
MKTRPFINRKLSIRITQAQNRGPIIINSIPNTNTQWPTIRGRSRKGANWRWLHDGSGNFSRKGLIIWGPNNMSSWLSWYSWKRTFQGELGNWVLLLWSCELVGLCWFWEKEERERGKRWWEIGFGDAFVACKRKGNLGLGIQEFIFST